MAELSTCPPLTRQSVIDAHELIKSWIHETPVLKSSYLNSLASTPRQPSSVADGRRLARPVLRLWFKCENMQRIGAFKTRGAFHAIERLKQDPSFAASGGLNKGVVAFSAGRYSLLCQMGPREY